MDSVQRAGAADQAAMVQQHPPPHRQCPRCDSSNTKFCYYNNYSQSQPRYFCKACRRYWTHGGTLRNVPVGGGTRKNKRARALAIAATNARMAAPPPQPPPAIQPPNMVGMRAYTQVVQPPPMANHYGGIVDGSGGLGGGGGSGLLQAFSLPPPKFQPAPGPSMYAPPSDPGLNPFTAMTQRFAGPSGGVGPSSGGGSGYWNCAPAGNNGPFGRNQCWDPNPEFNPSP